jgi:hypothetical protein
MMPERPCVAIVGNGPVAEGLAARIDASDMVIRFNEPAGAPERIGTRTDILFVMNSGKSMQRRVSDPAYLASPAFVEAHQIILPYHPSIIARYHPKPNLLSKAKGRKADWTADAIAVFGAAGKPVTVLPTQFYEACCEELGISPDKRTTLFPSTGLIGIRYALYELAAPPDAIGLYGFSWQGWKRHDWQRERAWADARLGGGMPS